METARLVRSIFAAMLFVIVGCVSGAIADQSNGRAEVEIQWVDDYTFTIDRAILHGCMASTFDPASVTEHDSGWYQAACNWVDPPCGATFQLWEELPVGAITYFAFMGEDVPCQ